MECSCGQIRSSRGFTWDKQARVHVRSWLVKASDGMPCSESYYQGNHFKIVHHLCKDGDMSRLDERVSK